MNPYTNNANTFPEVDAKNIPIYINLYWEHDIISLEELVSLLKDDGIDIYERNYRYTESYQKVKYEWVFADAFDAMSLEECIERFILPNEQKGLSYKSIYDMGNTVEFCDEDYDLEALADEIIDNMSSLSSGHKADEKDRIIDIITRKNRGLDERLRRYFGLDIKLFDKLNRKHQTEICKIRYFFYMLDNYDAVEPRIDYCKFLSNYSMENVDHSIHNHSTSNGWIFLHIVNSLAKEISLELKAKIRKELFRVVLQWEKFLTDAANVICHESSYDFSDIIDIFRDVPAKIREQEGDNVYKHSPIETLYLYMQRYQYRGHICDLISSNQVQTTDKSYDMPAKLAEKLQNFSPVLMSEEHIYSYLKDNIQHVVNCVYYNANKHQRRYLNDILRERTPKDEARLKNLLEEIYELIGYLKTHKDQLFNYTGEFSELLLISCLQAIILDKVNDEYKFFRSQNVRMSFGKDKKIKIQSELGQQCPYYGVQVVWVRKVIDRYNANLGMHSSRIQIKELEIVIDEIKLSIFEKINLDDIIMVHEKHLSEVSKIFKMLFDGMRSWRSAAEVLERIENKGQ